MAMSCFLWRWFIKAFSLINGGSSSVADETFAMSVLDVFLQFFLCFATHIALLALVSKASLTVDVLFRVTRKFFAASFARHRDGLRASLIRAVRHCSAALGF